MTLCFVWLLLTLAWLQNVSSFVEYRPLDTVAVINQSTYFNCSTTDPEILWYHYPVGSDERQGGSLVYRSGKFFNIYTNDFKIDTYDRNGTYFYNLVINTVRENFPGKYECQGNNGLGMVSSAQLIVIDSDPQCRSNSIPDGVIGRNDCGLESGELQLSCDVAFLGNVPPILEWTNTGQNSDIINITHELHGSRAISNASLSAEKYTDSTKFMCQTTQSVHHQHSCTPDLKVLYALNSTSHMDKLITDDVNCSVNTNSYSCRYQWKRYDEKNWKTVSNDSVLEPKNSGIYQCQVTCELLSKRCSIFGNKVNVSLSLNSGADVSRDSHFTIVVALSVSMFIVLLILLIFLIQRRVCRGVRKSEIPSVKSGSRTSQNKDEDLPLSPVALITPSDENHEKSFCQIVKPELSHVLTVKKGEHSGKPIAGIALLKEKLFLLFEKSSTIEVFGANIFKFLDSFTVENLESPLDIASCPAEDRLFVCFSGKIVAINRFGKVLKSWEVIGNKMSLSVSSDSTVILSIWESSLLKEYSADGQLMREVKLPSNYKPFHALKISDNEFLVIYEMSPCFGICVTNSIGEIIVISNNLSFPKYLSLNRSGKCLIADHKCIRILSIDEKFKMTNILSDEDGLIRPVRICSDNSSDRIFVVDNSERRPRVMIFEMLDRQDVFLCFDLEKTYLN